VKNDNSPYSIDDVYVAECGVAGAIVAIRRDCFLRTLDVGLRLMLFSIRVVRPGFWDENDAGEVQPGKEGRIEFLQRLDRHKILVNRGKDLSPLSK